MEKVTYAYYPVFRTKREDIRAVGGDLEGAAHDVEVLFKEWADRVTVRGAYSTVGFRPDAHLLMWWVASSPEDIQELLVQLRRTAFGQALELSWAFLGAVRPSEFNKQHTPAFVRGEPPRRYLSVYPFVRTSEWYLLAPEERAAMLREHGEIGREYPDVLPNTTSAFGLGDWEWILAFEADELHSIVDCLRHLRQAEARRFTKEEVPFVLGIRKELQQVARDLS